LLSLSGVSGGGLCCAVPAASGQSSVEEDQKIGTSENEIE